MLKIYGMPFSPPTNTVAMCANALDLPYEYVAIDLLKGEHRSEVYLALTPVGKIPVIDDDGFVLFESDAIVKYLCRKHQSALYPETLQPQAIVDQWCAFIANHIGSAMTMLLFNRVVAPLVDQPVDENALKTGTSFLKRFLKVCDKHLADNNYLANNQFSIADIALVATIDPAEKVEFDITPFSNLIRWRENLCQEPIYQKVHRKYGEPVAAGKL